MKIAIFSDCYLDLTGGIVTNINAEKAELEKRGHTVYVFSSAYPRSKDSLKNLAKNHIYPIPSCKIFGRGLTPIARRPKIIEKYLTKNFPELKDFDIFYIHYEAGCSIAGLRLAKKYHTPSIQVMHGREDIGEANLIPKGFRTFVAIMLNWFHSWYIPHQITVKRDAYLAKTLAAAKMWTLMVNHANFADLVITPSEHFRKKLIHYGVTKTIIPLHHGIDDSIISAKLTTKSYNSSEPLRIIWHSRVSGEKRILPFLKALSIVKNTKNSPRFILDIYGDGVDLKKAQKFVHKNHLTTVKFHGVQPFSKIYQQIQSSHLDVLVSYNYDTFGMTLIEAEAAGTPAFIADPDMKEIIPNGSFILSKDPSPEKMAEAILEITKNPSQITSMSEKMLKNRENIKNSAKIDKLEKIFNDIIKA